MREERWQRIGTNRGPRNNPVTAGWRGEIISLALFCKIYSLIKDILFQIESHKDSQIGTKSTLTRFSLLPI